MNKKIDYSITRKEYIEGIEPIAPLIKTLAFKYQDISKRALGITSEMAEFTIIQMYPDLNPAPKLTKGYDAYKYVDGKEHRVQIKGRVKHYGTPSSQRVGQIHRLKMQFDSLIFVLLNSMFEPFEIYEASLDSILKFMDESTNERIKNGDMSVSVFKRIAGKPIYYEENNTPKSLDKRLNNIS